MYASVGARRLGVYHNLAQPKVEKIFSAFRSSCFLKLTREVTLNIVMLVRGEKLVGRGSEMLPSLRPSPLRDELVNPVLYADCRFIAQKFFGF